MENVAPGIVHYVDPDILIASRGVNLYISSDRGNTWLKWCKLPVRNVKHLLGVNRWISRLTRMEVFRIVRMSQDYMACFGFGNIFLIDLKTGKAMKIGNISGSRVLTVCGVNGKVYYGEYGPNRERNPMSLYCYDKSKRIWSEVYSFTNIRHIHGVFWDNYQSRLWITTGDLDEESSIIRFNDKTLPEKVVSGSQQTRAVDLLFTKSGVYFATDAPDEQNFLCRLDRETQSIEKQQPVGGPVFWGRKENDWLFFSTVVEPTKVNRTDAVELWGRNKGNANGKWIRLLELQKDWGLNYFQHGQLKFPSGPGDGEYLWLSPYATEYDHRIFRIRLQDLP